MHKYRFLPMFFALFMYGCASTKYAITYNSEPPGAAVICNGINRGYTPTTLHYETQDHNKSTGVMNPAPCRAQWSSGASTEYSRTFSMNEFPNGVMQTLQRPNVPGYQQDAEFALKVQQMNYQRRQAQAAEDAADAARNANRQNNKTTCFTNFGITTCY